MPQHESQQVFQRIRVGNDPEAILNQIEQGNLLLQLALVPEHRLRYDFPYVREMPASLLQFQNIYLDTLVYDHLSKQDERLGTRTIQPINGESAYTAIYVKPYHAAQMADPRLALVEPSKWTSVYSDDRWMRKLLGRFFLTEYHLGSFFRMDYFLDDMIAMQDRFCSSLLVNGVLAWACVSLSPTVVLKTFF